MLVTASFTTREQERQALMKLEKQTWLQTKQKRQSFLKELINMYNLSTYLFLQLT